MGLRNNDSEAPKGVNGAPAAVAKAAEEGPGRGMVLPFQPTVVTFHHLNYSVDWPSVRPAQGTALWMHCASIVTHWWRQSCMA